MKEKYTFSREKLKDIIKSKGLTQAKVSIALGRSHGYFSSGIISKEFLKGLERYYGISGEDIEAKLVDGSKSSESVIEGPKAVNYDEPKAVNYDELYKCIYGAVYQAVKKALNE